MSDMCRDALERVSEKMIDKRCDPPACNFCGSWAHPDGKIFHEEDCPVPYVEAALRS